MQHTNSWRTWLMPRPYDWATAVFYLGALAVHFYFRLGAICQSCYLGQIGAILITVAVGLLFVLDRSEYWRYGETPSPRTAAFLLLLRTGLVILISLVDEFNFSMFLYILLPFSAFSLFSRWVSYGMAGFAWLVYLYKIAGYPDWAQDKHEIIFFIVYTAGLVFMVAMADVISREKASRRQAEKLLYDLEHSHQQLRIYATQVAELAATEERNRLARDIHDSLGHYLTVINVQLEKALAFRTRQPETADQAVNDAKRLASEALQDIRRSVGTLRETQNAFSLTEAIHKLTQDVAQGGLAVALQIEGAENGFAPHLLTTLYRAAQEGLTNVQKHAQASHAWLYLHFDEQQATLQLTDNGCGFSETIMDNGAQPNHGYGLQGLRERLELIQGLLNLENPQGYGARLQAIVPKHPL